MKKSITALITIGFGVSILLLILFVDDRLNPTYGLNEIVVDDTELSTIISSRELSDTALRTDLIIDDQEVIYDEVDNTFYYSQVEESSDSSSYISTATSLSVKDIFSNYLQIALTEENELVLYNKDFYSISSLVATPLPIMNITVSAETVDELGLDETYSIEEYTSADIYLYDNRAECDERSRVTSSASKIHMRGGTTIGFPQKSYRITLLDDSDDFDKTSKSSLLGMRKDDDWILYSAYSDY